jgi:uncharacterized Ntn-hydrolase superfamily protein
MRKTGSGPFLSTFSIAARDPDNGDLGVAVASKFLAVGAVVPWVEAGVGAMAIQAHPDLTYGPRGLELMRGGASAADTLGQLIAADPDRAIRQVGVVDASGGVAAHTGESCIPWAGNRAGETYTCQGNILTGAETLDAMAEVYEGTGGALSARLVAALSAGDRVGGDSRGRQGAAVYVVRKAGGYGGSTDVLVDLRVDDAPDPCAELRRLYALHRLYFESSPENEKLKIEGDLARELQEILARAGYRDGEASGTFDPESRNALDRLVGTENFEERVDMKRLTIDPPVLAYLRDRFGAGKD